MATRKVIPMTRRGGAKQTTVPPTPSIEARRARVAELLTMGHRPTAVSRLAAEEFRVHPQTIMDDLAAVRDQWAEETAEERPRMREEMIARIDAATLAARNDGKHGDVARLLKLRAEVAGLVGPKSVNVAVSATDGMSEEDMRGRIADIITAAVRRGSGAASD